MHIQRRAEDSARCYGVFTILILANPSNPTTLNPPCLPYNRLTPSNTQSQYAMRVKRGRANKGKYVAPIHAIRNTNEAQTECENGSNTQYAIRNTQYAMRVKNTQLRKMLKNTPWLNICCGMRYGEPITSYTFYTEVRLRHGLRSGAGDTPHLTGGHDHTDSRLVRQWSNRRNVHTLNIYY